MTSSNYSLRSSAHTLEQSANIDLNQPDNVETDQRINVELNQLPNIEHHLSANMEPNKPTDVELDQPTNVGTALPQARETWHEMRNRIGDRFNNPLMNPLHVQPWGGAGMAFMFEAFSYLVAYKGIPWLVDEAVIRIIDSCDCVSLEVVAWIKVVRYWLPYSVWFIVAHSLWRSIYQG